MSPDSTNKATVKVLPEGNILMVDSRAFLRAALKGSDSCFSLTIPTEVRRKGALALPSTANLEVEVQQAVMTDPSCLEFDFVGVLVGRDTKIRGHISFSPFGSGCRGTYALSS